MTAVKGIKGIVIVTLMRAIMSLFKGITLIVMGQ